MLKALWVQIGPVKYGDYFGSRHLSFEMCILLYLLFFLIL